MSSFRMATSGWLRSSHPSIDELWDDKTMYQTVLAKIYGYLSFTDITRALNEVYARTGTKINEVRAKYAYTCLSEVYDIEQAH